MPKGGMTPHYSDPLVTLYLGDCLDVMRELPDESVDAIVTDPPYGLEFMGKEWDRLWVEGDKGQQGRIDGQGGMDTWGKRPQYQGGMVAQKWHEAWATEAFRVAKPGAHILAFGGSRTVHRLASAIEDAGWEIRDELVWIYASGFPKSLDVSKAIDKQRTDDEAILRVTAFVRAGRDAMQLDNDLIDSRLGYRGMAHWWTFDKRRAGPRSHGGAAVPNMEQWVQLKALLHLSDEMDAEVWRLNGRKGQPGENWALREVLAERERKATGRMAQSEGGYAFGEKFAETAPATPDAQKWNGWGTALKPAHEPIVMARKPLRGTVAANVLAYGTGAINVDGTRIGYVNETPPDTEHWKKTSGGWKNTSLAGVVPNDNSKGRWPSNILLSDPELFDQPNPYVVGSGATPHNQSPETRQSRSKVEGVTAFGTGESIEYEPTDAGYSRFFIVPKSPRHERNRGLTERSSHPTVKPIDLMRHLVRLVTPPGGVCLDPFLGSGTTALAASEEGFRCIGIEREAEYLEIAKGRLIATPMGLGLDVPATTRPAPKTHPDLSKHQPKRRAPSENWTGGWVGTEDDAA